MGALEEAFRSFCTAGRKDVDCRGFIKLCRECQLTGDACPDSEVERIFQQVMPVSKRRVDFKRFEGALRLIAERSGVSLEDVERSVVESCPHLTFEQDRERRGSLHHEDKELSAPQIHHQREPEEKRGRQEKDFSAARDRQLSTSSTTCEDSDQSDSRASSASRVMSYKPSSCPFLSYPKHVPSQAAESQTPTRSLSDVEDAAVSICEQETTPSPQTQQKAIALEDVFASCCKKTSQGMDSKSFGKLCKKSCLIDKAFTLQDCMLIYSSAVPLDQQYMDFGSFQVALRNVASSKGLEEGLVQRMVTWSQEPQTGDTGGTICDGQEHTWPKQAPKSEALAPPPSPVSNLRRALSAGSLQRDSLTLPVQKRAGSKMLTSMPLTPLVTRNIQHSPQRMECVEPEAEPLISGRSTAGDVLMGRKKCFSSMPLTCVLQTPHATSRPSSQQGLNHSSSSPALQLQSSSGDDCFTGPGLQQRIWPSMPLCPVVRVH